MTLNMLGFLESQSYMFHVYVVEEPRLRKLQFIQTPNEVCMQLCSMWSSVAKGAFISAF